jgi:predicted MFS family arabinose efflux permease
MSFHLPTYFQGTLRREIRELYGSVGLLTLAVSSIQLFEAAYLYALGYSLRQIMLFWLGVYLVDLILLPIGGMIALRRGYEHAMLYSSFFLVLYFIALVLLPGWPALFFVAPLFLAIQKALYWPAYHADCATYMDPADESEEIAMMRAIGVIATILGPVFGGIVIATFGFTVLFILVCVLIVLSNLPLLSTRESVVAKTTTFRSFYQHWLAPARRRNLLAYVGFGEEIVGVIVWPIFLTLALASYLSTGILFSSATLLTAILMLWIGRVSDRIHRVRFLRWSAVIAAISWIVRPFGVYPLHLFALDTFGRFSRESLGIPLLSLTYDDAKNQDLMHTIVNFQLSLACGKALAAFVLFFLFSVTTTLSHAFFIAAGFSLLFALWKPTPRPLDVH